jgi:hypothetical protein
MNLDFFGGIFLTAIMVVNINAVISTLAIGRAARLGLAIVVGLWIGLQVSLATAGAFDSEFSRVFPLLGVMVALPPLAVGLAAGFSPSTRAALLALPMPLLVGLNFSRVLGIFFLLLAANGRLGGPFPISAGWGDIITGLAALPVALMIARGAASRAAIGAWNWFGAADLFLAVVLGTLSAEGSALQLIRTEGGSSAIVNLPWSLIPTVLVPFYLIMHGVVLAQLRRAGSEHGLPKLA